MRTCLGDSGCNPVQNFIEVRVEPPSLLGASLGNVGRRRLVARASDANVMVGSEAKVRHGARSHWTRLIRPFVLPADPRVLDNYPDFAVQLIMFPLEACNRNDQFWTALTGTQRERLLRHLVARFAAYPQILWLITNDAHYGPKFPNRNAMVREVGEVGDHLRQHDPWQYPRSTGHARRLTFFFGSEDWATYIHIAHAHDLGAQQYSQYHDFGKPVFLGEDRYEQDHGPRLDPTEMRCWQRRLYWSWLLSGGSTNYGGRWWAVHPYGATMLQGRPASWST